MKPSGMNKLFPLTLFLLLAFSSSSCSPQPYNYLHFGFYRDEAAESALRLAAVMNRAVEAKEGDDEFSFRVFLGFGADYLAYPEPAPSLSSYGIAEVAFERLSVLFRLLGRRIGGVRIERGEHGTDGFLLRLPADRLRIRRAAGIQPGIHRGHRKRKTAVGTRVRECRMHWGRGI